jgi:hypothetical protein
VGGLKRATFLAILCFVYAFYRSDNSGQQGTTKSTATLPKDILKNTSKELVRAFTALLHYFNDLSHTFRVGFVC